MPIGRNMYYMRGKKHKDGGIVIGNKTNGLEVEDGEVVKLDNDGTKVYSSMPLLNGNSPAQLVLNGFQPNKVFNAQERYKNKIGLKDDGTTKYAGGGSHPYGRVSENGINLIRSFEGYMPRVYRDTGGVETIGYGETDKNFINRYRTSGISRQAADAQLRNRAQWFYDGVAKRTKGWDKLNQQQRDALTSYAYNIGLGGYGAHKHLLSAIERGDYENAALNINAGFNDARNPGLKKRRIKERNLFIQGAVGIKSTINPTEPPVVSNPEFDKLVTPNNPIVDKFMKIKNLYDMTNNLPKFRAGGVHKNESVRKYISNDGTSIKTKYGDIPIGWNYNPEGKYVQTTYGNGSIKRIQVRPGQTPQQAINEYGAKQNKEYDAKVDNESFGKKVLNFVVDGLGFDSRGDDTGFHLDPNGKGGYKVRNVHMNHAPIEETIVANKVLGKPIELIGNHLVKPALKWIGKRAVRGAIKGTNEEILRHVPRSFRPKIANFADDAVVDSKLGVKEAESVGAKGKRGRVNKGSRSKVKNKTTTSNSSSTNNSANNVVDSGTTSNNVSGNSTTNTTTTNPTQSTPESTGNTKGSIRRIIDTIKGKVNRKTLNDVVGKVGKSVKYAKEYVTDKVRHVNKNAAVSDFMKNSSNNDYSYKNISRFVEKFNEGSRVKISEDDFINELYSRLDRNNGNVYRNLTRTRGTNAGNNSIERTTGTTTETATSTESSSATNATEGTTTSTTNAATNAATSTTEGTTTTTAGTATGNDGRGKFRAILDHVKNNKIKYTLGAIATGVGVYNMNRNPDRTPHGVNYVENVTPAKPAQRPQPVNPNNNTNVDTTRVDSTNTQPPQTTETTETTDNQNANKVVIRNPNVSVTKEQSAKPSTTNNAASTPATRTNITQGRNTNHNTPATQPTQGNTSVTHTNGNSNTTSPASQNTPASTSTTSNVNTPFTAATPASQANGTNVSSSPSTGKLQAPSGVGTTPTSTNADVVQFNRASGNNSLFGNTGPVRVSGGTFAVGQRKGHYDSNGNPVFDTQNVNIDGKDAEAFVPYTKGSGDNKTIIPSKKFTMNYDSYRLPTINELRDAGDKTLGVSRAANDVLMQNYLKENLYNGKAKDVYGKTIDVNYKPETPRSSGKISLWDRFKALDDGTKSDIIGIGANSLASVAGFINNAAMLNGLQEPIAPAPAYAAKLKTTVNVAPQLNTVDSGVNRMISDTNDNTASSNVAASRNIAARLTGMANKNQIYSNKENAETELINKDKLNQQEVHNANALQYNQYLNNLVAFRNNVADKRSENINGLINGLNSGVQDFLTKREQRTNFRNTIKASLVANPDAALLMGNAFKGLLPESFMQTLYNRQAEAEEMKRRELQKRLTAMDAIKGAADKLNVQ
nr:MAG TPA: Lysozyme [Crassvirales sp.]